MSLKYSTTTADYLVWSDAMNLIRKLAKDENYNMSLLIALLYMLLQLRVQPKHSFLACLFLNYGKLLGAEYLLPSQGENIRYSESCETAKCYK